MFSDCVSLVKADEAARNPGDPPVGPGEVEALLFRRPPDRRCLPFLATIDGHAAGFGYGSAIVRPVTNERPGYVSVFVLPEFRRRGLATALLKRIVPALAALDHTSILGDCCQEVDFVAATALFERLGMTSRGEERCSRVRVSDIDDELLQDWIDGAQVSAAGYRLEQWEGPAPDHLAERWSQALTAMEDAPLDDIDYEPHTRDVDAQRAADLARRAGGFRSYRTLALDASGDAAGMTALEVHVDRPQLGLQDDTAVLAAHRGHRLGKWLKAANYRMVRQATPELEVIETFNAQSNRWMLDINVEMGFRPHLVYSVYQAPIEVVLGSLD